MQPGNDITQAIIDIETMTVTPASMSLVIQGIIAGLVLFFVLWVALKLIIPTELWELESFIDWKKKHAKKHK